MTRKEQIEVMARAIAGSRTGTFNYYATFEANIPNELAEAALEAKGMVVRPREPTEAMAEAGTNRAVIHNEYGENIYLKNVEEVYRAMIDVEE